MLDRCNLKTAVTVMMVLAVVAPLSAAEDNYVKLLTYDFGQSRAALSAIEQEIREADAAGRKAIEGKLLAVLKSPKAKFAPKQFACRMLRRVGTCKSTPVLAKLLTDEKLSHMARFAMESLNCPMVNPALRAALGRVKGNLLIGVVGTLGARRDEKAVPQLAKLVSDKDTGVAGAAINALGRIGGAEAAKALDAAEVDDKLKAARGDALMQCADRLLAGGKASEATAIYRKMYVPASPATIRIAALRGIAISDKANAASTLLSAMKDKNPKIQQAAGGFMALVSGPAAVKAFAAALPSLPASTRVVVLGVLARGGDASVLPVVLRATKSDEEPVRVAALSAVGELGDASVVPALLASAAKGGAEGGAARSAMVSLRGDKVNQTIIARMNKGDANQARLLIGVLTDRRAAEAVAPLLATAKTGKDPNVVADAVKALGVLGDLKDISALIDLLLETDSPATRDALEKAIGNVASRQKTEASRVTLIVAALPKASADAKVSLLKVLGRLGGAKALAAVRSAAGSSDAKLKDAGVRALAGWSDDSAAVDLLKIAGAADSEVHQILALRGYVRLAGTPAKGRTTAKTVAMFRKAAKLAKRADEKRLILGGLRNVRSIDAVNMAVEYLSDKALAREAGWAAVNIARNISRDRRLAKAISDAMKKVVEACKNDRRLVRDASRYIRK